MLQGSKMTIMERLFGGEKMAEPTTKSEVREKCVGKIIKVSPQGWGFISSKDIEFTRIFFHWTGLTQDTLRFPELKKGMKVEFEAIEVEGKGIRAFKVKVLE